MDRDRIIRMARDCGFDDYEQDAMLQGFAALIAAAEREECVKAIRAVCAGMYNCDATGGPVDEYIAKWRAVEAIRERGQS